MFSQSDCLSAKKLSDLSVGQLARPHGANPGQMQVSGLIQSGCSTVTCRFLTDTWQQQSRKFISARRCPEGRMRKKSSSLITRFSSSGLLITQHVNSRIRVALSLKLCLHIYYVCIYYIVLKKQLQPFTGSVGSDNLSTTVVI